MNKKLVIYLVCEPETPELAEAAVEGGADIVELGIPFSDPLAEGPTIRLASERALARGMRTKQCLECIAANPQCERTSARSLSPRPERQTRTSSASRSSARARACELSSAGMIPSVFARRWKASSASSSVHGT